MTRIRGAIALSVAVAMIAATNASAAVQPTLSAVADSYVTSSPPGSNYGAATQMRVDGSPTVRSYVRFTVPTPPGPITKATLRVLTKTTSPGFQVRGVASTWLERSITFANGPAPSPTVTATTTSKGTGVWVPLDVTPLVTGAGDVSFAITTTSATAMAFATREAGATSAPQLIVETGGAPPVNTALPTISGTLRDGQALTATTGTWSGTTPMTFAYRWRRCATTCNDITGATAQSYTLTGADAGQKVLVAVTATNASGSASSSSAQTATIAGNAPLNIAAPTVSGIPEDGRTLTGTAGTWSGTSPITLTSQWQRCDVLTGVCSDISGATGLSYKLTSADVRYKIRLSVTGTNLAGTLTVPSAQTAAVVALPPVNTSPPSVSATPREGVALSAAAGTWTGSLPITFGYQWQRCDAQGNGCTDIDNATQSDYTATSADIGSTLVVVVTADNAAPGSVTATSAASGVVAERPVAPSNLTPPTVSGTASDGAALDGDPGTWDGTSPLTYKYQWRRCTDASTCSDIAGATALQYKLTSADVGYHVALEVTAHNDAGEATLTSDPTADAVAAVAPANTSAPTISGSLKPGGVVTADNGVWSGTTPLEYSYKWQRCDSAGGGCVDIDHPSTQSYTVTTDDVDSTLRVEVTATNSLDFASATSPATDVVTARTPPAAPTGLRATGGAGTVALQWTAVSDPDLAGYRIYRQNADGSWPGAPTATTTASRSTDSSLTNGTTYTYRVTAYNTFGDESAPSDPASATPQATSAGDPVIAAAGDISCDVGQATTATLCHQGAVSNLLVGANLARVLTLGDNQYECGAYQSFLQQFDPSWGRVKSLIRPAPGNHEYATGTGCSPSGTAAGYFDYFDGVGNATGPAGDRGQGWYSYDVGAWHLIALNANCGSIGGCGAGSPQETWLKSDLAAHPAACTLAYWHHPRFSSGQHGNNTAYDAFWKDLYAAGADLVLNGHDHEYERFAPQTPTAVADPAGIREFVVGTGGKSQTTFLAAQPNSEVRSSGIYGVLQLTLHPASYDWVFAREGGGTPLDSGTQTCH